MGEPADIVTVECQFDVGAETTDLATVVRFNKSIDPAVKAYPHPSGQVAGEAERVERALECALSRVREARQRYRDAPSPVDSERDQACLECNHPITEKLSAVHHAGRGWTHLKCTPGFNRA